MNHCCRVTPYQEGLDSSPKLRYTSFMNITTKFDIGNTVYRLKDNSVTTALVLGIEIKVVDRTPVRGGEIGTIVKSNVYYSVTSEKDKIGEGYLFESKEALLASL
jgi:hypothetical protein